MFNSTVSMVRMTEQNAYKYLYTKFALRGIGESQFNAAVELNCVNTDWARIAVTAMNYRRQYIENLTGTALLRIKKMMQFKTDTADMQRASEVVDKEQIAWNML